MRDAGRLDIVERNVVDVVEFSAAVFGNRPVGLASGAGVAIETRKQLVYYCL